MVQEIAEKRIIEICNFYKDQKTPLMMILSDIQNEFGYIPLDVQEIVAEQLNISVAEISGIISFFSFFSIKPKGKNIIAVCLGTACYAKNAQNILNKVLEILHLNKIGETTTDGLFTIDALHCVGACTVAPVMKINNKIFSKVNVNDIHHILNEYQLEKEENGKN